MAKPTIVTRAGKGSALTWTEGDSNLTNLRDATITVTDGTNSKAIDLNGTITFTAGSNVTLSVNSSTGAVTINSTASGGTPAGSNQQIQFNNNGAFGASSGLYYDGTSLRVSSGNIESLYSNGDEGGEFRLATAATNTTLSGGSVAIDIYQNRLRIFETGGSTRGVYLDLAGAANTVGSALAVQGTAASFTTLTSTGSLTFKDPRESIYDNGNSGAATITPNAANGSVQKYTLTGNITWNAFGTPVAGQSITMILVQDATGSRTLTSTGIKWAGGTKTLSTAANSIDIATVYYDGTNYYGSLAKGFA